MKNVFLTLFAVFVILQTTNCTTEQNDFDKEKLIAELTNDNDFNLLVKAKNKRDIWLAQGNYLGAPEKIKITQSMIKRLENSFPDSEELYKYNAAILKSYIDIGYNEANAKFLIKNNFQLNTMKFKIYNKYPILAKLPPKEVIEIFNLASRNKYSNKKERLNTLLKTMK